MIKEGSWAEDNHPSGDVFNCSDGVGFLKMPESSDDREKFFGDSAKEFAYGGGRDRMLKQ
jgi:hypothetical protein